MPNTTAWKTAPPDRPLLITAVCLLLFFTLVAVVIDSAQVLPGTDPQFGDWFWIYSITEALVALVCVVGLWFMQRWSLYLMAAFVLVRVAIAQIISLPLPGLPFVVAIATLLIGLIYLQQME